MFASYLMCLEQLACSQPTTFRQASCRTRQTGGRNQIIAQLLSSPLYPEPRIVDMTSKEAVLSQSELSTQAHSRVITFARPPQSATSLQHLTHRLTMETVTGSIAHPGAVAVVTGAA